MAYRLKTTESIEREMHRVSREQIDKALAEIGDEKLDQAETIHQVRKRCKKLRALLRLFRGCLSDSDTYSFESAYFRGAARSLSDLRDVEAIIESYDKLMKIFGRDVDQRHFSGIHRKLLDDREQFAMQANELSDKLDAFKERMIEARKRIDNWRLTADGPDVVEAGLKRTYRRGREAMDAAYENPSCESFHEWRKRVKYHWYHCRLLRAIWTPVLKARIGELDKLATLLGDYHDLDVLRPRIKSMSNSPVNTDAPRRLLDITDERQKEIRTEAQPLGKKLFAEKPKHLCRRFASYWSA
jgi:CHAD domain-containing protein